MGWKISRNRRKTSVSPFRSGWEPLEVRTVPTAIIALVDTGIDLGNSSLAPYYDFTNAYDAYNKQTAASYGNGVVSDLATHGRYVADFMVQGITATKAQSGAGGADVKIMPIRVAYTSGGTTYLDGSAIVRGIYWAADHGADVINLSYKSTGETRLYDASDPHNLAYLSDAIKYAESMGAVVVTASANDSKNIDLPGNAIFPAYADDTAYAHANPAPTNLMVAAGVDSSGNLTSISNWGPIHVDFGALANGAGETSYSAGYTSGVSAVIADLLPSTHTAKAVVDIIKQTVTPKTQSVATNWSSTNGNINPAGAVASVVGQQGPKIIAPVGVTASSTFGTTAVAKAIDGSGLSTPLANGAAMPTSYPAHGNNFFDNWVSNGNGSAGTEWITVQLVGAAAPAVNIAGFHWWAYTADEPQRGIRTAMVSTSADGVNYSAAVPYTFYQGNNVADSGRDYALYATGVRYVKFSNLLNFGSDSYGSFVGLGEVRFITVPTPPPTIIAPVGATASSTFGTTAVAKAIDGSGLSTPLANGAAMPTSYPAHGNNFFDNWVSNGNGSAGTEWITVQLVGAAAPAVNIAGFHWWAYTADEPQRGIRTAMVSTSADGVNYSAAVPYTFYQGNNVADSGRDYALYATGVRYVKFSNLLNFGSDSYGSFVGLGEVRFISAPS